VFAANTVKTGFINVFYDFYGSIAEKG
jgi:hypothetical protein